MSDSDDWALGASDASDCDFAASNHDGDAPRTIAMAGTLLYVGTRLRNPSVTTRPLPPPASFHWHFMCRRRYLPDQNLIFDSATQLVYANIGTAPPLPATESDA